MSLKQKKFDEDTKHTPIVHSSFNHQKWVIETQFPKWEDTLQYWDEATNFTDINQTASNNARQAYFEDGTGDKLADMLREYANSILSEIKAPIRVGDKKIGWTLEYFPNGWQAIHNHAEEYTTISIVLCIEGQEDSGVYYAMLPEPNGTQKISLMDQIPGKLIISEGDVWHGAYPATVTKKVFVFDFLQIIVQD